MKNTCESTTRMVARAWFMCDLTLKSISDICDVVIKIENDPTAISIWVENLNALVAYFHDQDTDIIDSLIELDCFDEYNNIDLTIVDKMETFYCNIRTIMA